MIYNLFRNISFKRLEKLYNLIINNPKNLSNIRLSYNNEDVYFEEQINFLEQIDLIKIKKNSVVTNLQNSNNFRSVLINHIMLNENFFVPIKNYLGEFKKNSKDNYVLKHDTYLNIINSNIRNFLISLRLLIFKGNMYIIIDNDTFKKFKNYFLSPQKLKDKLEQQAIIGLEAEKFIFNIEKKKCDLFKKDLKPEHIALKDVAAGYDILSYEKKGNNLKKIFIEVKAVSASDYRFYISENEIRTAEKYKSQYYVYLLPIKKSDKNKFDLKNLKKINDIKKNIFNEKTKWNTHPDGYIITKKI